MNGEAFTTTAPTSLNDWIDGARLPEKSVTVYGRADLHAEIEDLESQIKAAESAGDSGRPMMGASPVVEMAKRVESLKAEMQGSARTFRFRALSKAESKPILTEAPRAKDDDGDMVPDQDYVAAHWLARAAVPPMTPEQVEQIRAKVGEGQFGKMWNAAFAVSTDGQLSVPFSPRASAILSRQGSSEN